MMRRSTRLQSLGYYNLDGLPTISYRETSCKIFRKRRKCKSADPKTEIEIVPHIDMNLVLDTDSDSETIICSEFDLETNADTIPYTDFDLEIDNITSTNVGTDSDAETVTYTVLDTDSDTETILCADLDIESDTEPIPHKDLNMNTEAGMIREEEEPHSKTSWMTIGSKLFPKRKYKENISLFFITCLVVFVLAYPIYAMSFTPEESPASPIAADMASSGYCKEMTTDPIELMKTLRGCLPP
ncbi:bone sialoprotein-binding protein-like [Poecilia formosa]|uniref:bone sialoprotein-binding protein-like n=1 Tax=Poecilia formosa TaxID=48698 RepID=UPI0007B8CF4D|nr:PREDICTED: bone sialoprotein-binding protein-like [Poecilia formosa]